MEQCLSFSDLLFVENVKPKSLFRQKVVSHIVTVFCTSSEILILDAKTKENRATFHVQNSDDIDLSSLVKVIPSLERGTQLLVISDGTQTVLLEPRKGTALFENRQELEKRASEIMEYYCRIAPSVSGSYLEEMQSSPVSSLESMRRKSDLCSSDKETSPVVKRSSVPHITGENRLSANSQGSRSSQSSDEFKLPYAGTRPQLDPKTCRQLQRHLTNQSSLIDSRLAKIKIESNPVMQPSGRPESSNNLHVPIDILERDSGIDPETEDMNEYDMPHWLLTGITRTEAIEMVANQPDGVFLIREAEKSPYALTCVFGGKVLHFSIRRTVDAMYELDANGRGEKFCTLDEFVHHYKRTPITCSKGSFILTNSV